MLTLTCLTYFFALTLQPNHASLNYYTYKLLSPL